jgi:hypothetical protein
MKNIATETISDSVENLPVLSIGVRKGYRECAAIAAIMRAFLSSYAYSRLDGGEGEIRTHGKLAPTLVFKTRAINHSATSPYIVLFNSLNLFRQQGVRISRKKPQAARSPAICCGSKLWMRTPSSVRSNCATSAPDWSVMKEEP